MKNIFQNLFIKKTKVSNESLNKWNITMAVVTALEGVAILFVGIGNSLPLTVLFTTSDFLETRLTGQSVKVPAVHQLLSVNLVYLLATVFFIAAIFHLLTVTAYRDRYQSWVKKGINPLRWVQFGLCSGVMLLVLAFLVGVYDVGSLALIFGSSLVASLSGFMLEARFGPVNRRLGFKWLSSMIATIAIIIPWLVLALYLLSDGVYGNGWPLFVGVIYASLLIVYLAVAVNLHLVRTKWGKWATYGYGERWYMSLNLLAMTILTWQIYAGFFHP